MFRPASRRLAFRLTALACVAATTPALASGGGHGDPSAPIVLMLAVVMLVAKLGGDFAVRLKQPAVLGELLVGVVLGNLTLLGLDWAEPMKSSAFLDMAARVGVIILLFEVGLESTVSQMMKVGLSALLVAIIGVAVPFGLGFGVAKVMLPTHSIFVHLFIGATLTATSVGITARVLKDLQKSQTSEARIVLGAAVIDDVLGLVILAVVTGVITAADQGSTLAVGDVVLTLGKALGFLVGSLVLGVWVSPRLFSIASNLRAHGVLLAVGLGLCFFMSWAADAIGLAPIVGAFAAGLVLEDVHYQDLQDREQHTLEELVRPISYFLVPIFFVLMGMRTDLRSFADPSVLSLAGALCVVAIIGKVVAGLGSLQPMVDKLSVGIGMVPRGEVGLIFASIGAGMTIRGEPVVAPSVFSAVVVMVIVTTMVTPPFLKMSLARAAKRLHQKQAAPQPAAEREPG